MYRWIKKKGNINVDDESYLELLDLRCRMGIFVHNDDAFFLWAGACLCSDGCKIQTLK